MNYIDPQKLEIARAKKGKPLKELGIDANIIVRVRKGSPVRAATVYKLAQALGCDVEDIIRKED